MVDAMNQRELLAALDARGADHTECVSKDDLAARLKEVGVSPECRLNPYHSSLALMTVGPPGFQVVSGVKTLRSQRVQLPKLPEMVYSRTLDNPDSWFPQSASSSAVDQHGSNEDEHSAFLQAPKRRDRRHRGPER